MIIHSYLHFTRLVFIPRNQAHQLFAFGNMLIIQIISRETRHEHESIMNSFANCSFLSWTVPEVLTAPLFGLLNSLFTSWKSPNQGQQLDFLCHASPNPVITTVESTMLYCLGPRGNHMVIDGSLHHR